MSTWEQGNLSEVFDQVFDNLFKESESFFGPSLTMPEELCSLSSEELFSTEDELTLDSPLSDVPEPFEPALVVQSRSHVPTVVQPPPIFTLESIRRTESSSDDEPAEQEARSRKRPLDSAAVTSSSPQQPAPADASPTKQDSRRPRRAAVAARVATKKVAVDLDDSSYDPASSSCSSSESSPIDTTAPTKKRRGRRAAREIIAAEGIVPPEQPENVDPAIAAVALSRERLLTITSDEMEQRFSELHASRHLTQAEMKELRRQRRLVKNREYAQQSRNKKKVVQENIEETMDKLRKNNSQLRTDLVAVKEEAVNLRHRLSAAVEAASALGESGTALLSILLGSADPNPKRRRVATEHGMASSAVLFVMLFSFGIFLNGDFFSSSSSSTRAPVVGLHNAAPLSRDGVNSHAPVAAPGPLYTGRALLCSEADSFVDAAFVADVDRLAALAGERGNNTTTDAMPPLVPRDLAPTRMPVIAVSDK